MVIGIDIDDTITETSKNIESFLKEFGPSYQDYHDLPLEKYEEFMNKYIDIIMETDPLRDGVKKFFDYCNEKKYRIIIITARTNTYTKNSFWITEEYLKKNHLKYDKIIFEQVKKGDAAFKNQVNIFIDDKENVLDDVNSYGIKCIRFTNLESKYQTFYDWKDILEYIKQKEG